MKCLNCGFKRVADASIHIDGRGWCSECVKLEERAEQQRIKEQKIIDAAEVVEWDGPEIVEEQIKELLFDINHQKQSILSDLNWKALGHIPPPEPRLYNEGRLQVIDWLEERVEDILHTFLYFFSTGKLELSAAGGSNFAYAKGLCERYEGFIKSIGGDIDSMTENDIFAIAQGIIETTAETASWYKAKYGDPHRIYLPHFTQCAVEGYLHGYFGLDDLEDDETGNA